VKIGVHKGQIVARREERSVSWILFSHLMADPVYSAVSLPQIRSNPLLLGFPDQDPLKKIQIRSGSGSGSDLCFNIFIMLTN
jgi:hypothetical protein